MSIRVSAPAKINLTLQVGRPRADGLHPLQSVVAFADVSDVVHAAPGETLTLHIGGPFAAGLSGADNLVLRAARALAAFAGVEPRAALRLEKHLPVASGIGGGSSDAAAALKACNVLWSLAASDADLIGVARTLGSDVPVCLAARGAYMAGAGETFAALDLPALNAVLVNPRAPLATSDVYRRFDVMNLGAAFSPAPAPVWGNMAAAIAGVRALGNDLDAPARALMPQVSEIAETLGGDRRARAVSLSGSGATLFALVDNAADAAALAAELNARRPDWWSVSVRLA